MVTKIQIPDTAIHDEFNVAMGFKMREPLPFASFRMLDNGECLALKPNGSCIWCPDISSVYMPAYDRRKGAVNAL